MIHQNTMKVSSEVYSNSKSGLRKLQSSQALFSQSFHSSAAYSSFVAIAIMPPLISPLFSFFENSLMYLVILVVVALLSTVSFSESFASPMNKLPPESSNKTSGIQSLGNLSLSVLYPIDLALPSSAFLNLTCSLPSLLSFRFLNKSDSFICAPIFYFKTRINEHLYCQ